MSVTVHLLPSFLKMLNSPKEILNNGENYNKLKRCRHKLEGGSVKREAVLLKAVGSIPAQSASLPTGVDDTVV